MAAHAKGPRIFGVIAEFRTPAELVNAVVRAREAGYLEMEAYSPFPVEGLAEALGFHERKVPFIVLIGGILGGIAGYALQYWVSVHAYPLNVGGRPLHSWPAFIVPTFETTILFAALSAVLGMLALNGLPMPYHPVFNVERFALASRDRFFLIVLARDRLFDPVEVRRFLEGLGPREVTDVED